MVVKDLIEKLQHLPQDAVVQAFDVDSGEYVEVTGYVYYPYSHVYLLTDDIT